MIVVFHLRLQNYNIFANCANKREFFLKSPSRAGDAIARREGQNNCPNVERGRRRMTTANIRANKKNAEKVRAHLHN